MPGEEDRLSSLVLIGSSETFDCEETIESLWALRVADGLDGRIGTAGTTGSTGRLLGCVGVSCVLGAGGGAAEDGVVGCVDMVSEGPSETSGVGVCTGGRPWSSSLCVCSKCFSGVGVTVTADGCD